MYRSCPDTRSVDIRDVTAARLYALRPADHVTPVEVFAALVIVLASAGLIVIVAEVAPVPVI